MMSLMNDSQIIDRLGGTTAVATLCDVTTGAVSQWRHDGIPRERLMYLRAVRPNEFTTDDLPPCVAPGKGDEKVA